jgi:excisionase family DNA binding protein
MSQFYQISTGLFVLAWRKLVETEKAYLTTADVAERLGLSRQRVTQLIVAGMIPHIRRGRLYLVPRRAYERWMETEEEAAMAGMKGGN